MHKGQTKISIVKNFVHNHQNIEYAWNLLQFTEILNNLDDQ